MPGFSPLELEALALSLRVALWSVLFSLPVGLFIAWLLARHEFFGKGALNAVVHLPLVLPPVVVGYLLLVLLGREGPLGQALYRLFGVSLPFTWQGAALAAAVMAFPLMVRAMRLSLENVDRRLEAAARTLGARPFDVFVTVTLPLTAPGILVGALLGFARSLGEFGATITFAANIPGETRTLPLALFSMTQTPGGETQALRLAALSVLLSLAALAVSEYTARRLRARIDG
ncbi:MAG: molybdate ABC transporter permease subunit [Proteobacteria bacterium]|nr:molybdate ABC transporter permease subunit [Pseudomonadota bacterium]MCH8001540.1 molybdate ABC transporter permease subunit [Pseudomonadota bacterium]